MMTAALSVLAAVLLDGLLGEPKHWHPLVGFGRLANRAEQVCYGAANLDPRAARVGFVCAQPELLARLNTLLGPWTICSAARWVASAALKDRSWQESTRLRLLEDSARLHALLSEYGLAPDGGCSLFQWGRTPLAVELHQHFAGLGILTRLFAEPYSLRFGVPGNEADWQRLEAALTQVTGSNRAELDR